MGCCELDGPAWLTSEPLRPIPIIDAGLQGILAAGISFSCGNHASNWSLYDHFRLPKANCFNFSGSLLLSTASDILLFKTTKHKVLDV